MPEFLTATQVTGQLRVGDTISLSTSHWERRKWWQLWKPKWTEHPAEFKVLRVNETIEAGTFRITEPPAIAIEAGTDGTT